MAHVIERRYLIYADALLEVVVSEIDDIEIYLTAYDHGEKIFEVHVGNGEDYADIMLKCGFMATYFTIHEDDVINGLLDMMMSIFEVGIVLSEKEDEYEI